VAVAVRRSATFSIIWAGGFTDRAAAEAALDTGLVDLIAFGRPDIANPDLGERLKHGWSLAEADPSTYYTRRSVPRLVARTAVWRGATSMTIVRLSRPSPMAEHLGGFPGLAENAAARPNTRPGWTSSLLAGAAQSGTFVRISQAGAGLCA
jgi:NADH:flavin oxidoreductase / NADH oxidase family